MSRVPPKNGLTTDNQSVLHGRSVSGGSNQLLSLLDAIQLIIRRFCTKPDTPRPERLEQRS